MHLRTHTRTGFFLALAICGQSVAAPAAPAQTQPQSQSEGLIYSLKGPDLFRAYCSPCHGATGKGDGPAAPALRASVPDLTLLARKNGGHFPTSRVERIISGDDILASHGSREMPIWGPVFHQIEDDRDYGNVRLQNLVKYLAAIQLPVESGSELYAVHCAVCHGNDLRGGTSDPPPPPYRVPPDLTMLARRHGGKFPEAYVSHVLRNGVMMPAHGPAEMPIWGEDFRVEDRLDQAQVESRIKNLVNYIRSRQAK